MCYLLFRLVCNVTSNGGYRRLVYSIALPVISIPSSSAAISTNYLTECSSPVAITRSSGVPVVASTTLLQHSRVYAPVLSGSITISDINSSKEFLGYQPSFSLARVKSPNRVLPMIGEEVILKLALAICITSITWMANGLK